MSATGLHTLVRRMCIHKCEHFGGRGGRAPLAEPARPLLFFFLRGSLSDGARSIARVRSLTPRRSIDDSARGARRPGLSRCEAGAPRGVCRGWAAGGRGGRTALWWVGSGREQLWLLV
jgi:hypothetical protein